MAWMKRLTKYCVIFAVCYFIINILTFNVIKSSYKTKETDINFEQPKVEIYESKATITNGYVKGKITNNTNENLVNKILKLDFLSSRDVLMGTKYVDIPRLESGMSTDFISQFNFDNVGKINISYMDKEEIPDINKLDFSLDKLSNNKTNWKYLLLGIFIFFGENIAALSIL